MSTETKAVHTPGPWRAGSEEDACNAMYVLAPGRAIAQVIHDLDLTGDLDEQDEINARLIAACPDMLEALKLAKNVMFLLHDEVKALGHKAEQVPEKIRAAILKAEGEL